MSTRTFAPLVSLVVVACLGSIPFAGTGRAADDAFQVGVGQRDVTPQARMPMWGYGARRDALSEGTLDPLFAKAIVIQAKGGKVAIVGTDLGRGPTPPMMEMIREQLREKADIEHVIISGSHSHHGPVIELTDKEGHGAGKFDAAVAYARQLPELLIEAILEANENLQPARIGWATKDLDYNRNRHTQRQPKATDPMLAVVRFDDLEGQPIAVLVNFAAHPVMTEASLLKYSADWPGFMRNKVESLLNTKCVFMQGAAGDLSPNPVDGRGSPQLFGEALADHVVELAQSIESSTPKRSTVQGKMDQFAFDSRVDFTNPVIQAAFSRAFFPELVRNFADEFGEGIKPELNTVVLNDQVALVAGSGEFFSNHSRRLKERSYTDLTLFFGYANGHQLYFPTIEAASEGGYGADPTVSPVELGAGERIMNQALINIYGFLGKFATEPALRHK